MRILWLANIPLPEASLLMNETPSPLGGWLTGSSLRLSAQKGIDLSVAFPHKPTCTLKKISGKAITYYAFPPVKTANGTQTLSMFECLLRETAPDIVHIHGTEFPHALTMMNACEKHDVRSVISIQGLVSVYSKHMTASLPWNVAYGQTLRTLLRGDSVIGLKKQFEKRGRDEVKALQKTRHVIGRTEWDRACTMQINPQAHYHFCNETLREEFYKHQWDMDTIDRFSIFLSQGHSPIKGLHYALEAMAEVVKIYPEARMYISGKDPTGTKTLRDRLLLTFYGKYIGKTINRLKLRDQISFTGALGEREMCQRYLKSHVFICPSSIENSPNSLAEAMILGVPCIASYVGGVPDILRYGEEGFLYQADAPYMLAHYILRLFRDHKLASTFSQKARESALQRHDKGKNATRLLEIYTNLLSHDGMGTPGGKSASP